MKTWPSAFNTYLLAVLAVLLAGCHTHHAAEDKAAAKKYKKEFSVLRLHLEMTADGSNRAMAVKIHRETPVEVTVERQSCLDEREIEQASVVESMGSFLLRIQFTRRGGWLLENLTASNIGRRFAIFSEFGQTRWLAAPMIARRASDGVFHFTPDASREEAERIARGLNNNAAKLKKPLSF
jgi:preprotein translocase subunit SecD